MGKKGKKLPKTVVGAMIDKTVAEVAVKTEAQLIDELNEAKEALDKVKRVQVVLKEDRKAKERMRNEFMFKENKLANSAALDKDLNWFIHALAAMDQMAP